MEISHTDAPRFYGLGFARVALALGATRSLPDAAAMAQRAWGENNPEARVLKAATAIGSVAPSPSGWGAELSTFQAEARDFLAVAARTSVFERLVSQMRLVSRGVPVLGVQVEPASEWRGESKPAVVVAPSLQRIVLEPYSLGSIVVETQELERMAGGDMMLRDALIRGSNKSIDAAFLNPSSTAIDGVRPASVTNGAPAVSATANPVVDFKALFAAFGGELEASYLAMHPRTAVALALRSEGAFADLNARGGMCCGLPALTSRGVPLGLVALIDPTKIVAIDEGPDISVARHATVVMSSTPDDPSAERASLWQRNLVALRIGRAVNWVRAQTDGVAYINGAAW